MLGAFIFSVCSGLIPNGGWSSIISRIVGSGSTSASITFNTDGTCTASPGTTPNYVIPSIAGIGSRVWIRLTPTSGSFTANAMSSWAQISSNRVASVTQTGAGTQSCTYTMELSFDGGASVALTKTGNIMSAQVLT